MEPEKKKKQKNTKVPINFEPDTETNSVGQPLDSDNLVKEALSIAARRKLAQRMIRVARKMAVARKRARARFADDKQLKRRAQKLARSIFRKRMAGQRGQNYGKLSMSDKIAIDKMIDKQSPKIKKLVTRIFPAVKRAEAIRLQKVKQASSDANDQRHKKKFHGRKQ